MNFRRIGIVGLGLIGSSLGRALARLPDVTVLGADADERHVRYCLEHGAIQGRISGMLDALFLAVPPAATLAALEACQKHLEAESVVSDVASVKRGVFEALRARYPSPPWRFISSHPVAGSEHAGPEAGNAALFEGRKLYLTPYGEAGGDALERLAALWRSLGAQVQPPIGWEAHDALFAAISHLPHLMAFAAARACPPWREEERGWAAAWLRIAHSAPELWADIFYQNRRHVALLCEKVQAVMGRQALEPARALREAFIPRRLKDNAAPLLAPPTALLGLAQRLASAMLHAIQEFGAAHGLALEDSGGAGLADITSPVMAARAEAAPALLEAMQAEIARAQRVLQEPRALLAWCREAKDAADRLPNAA